MKQQEPVKPGRHSQEPAYYTMNPIQDWEEVTIWRDRAQSLGCEAILSMKWGGGGGECDVTKSLVPVVAAGEAGTGRSTLCYSSSLTSITWALLRHVLTTWISSIPWIFLVFCFFPSCTVGCSSLISHVLNVQRLRRFCLLVMLRLDCGFLDCILCTFPCGYAKKGTARGKSSYLAEGPFAEADGLSVK